MKKVKLILTMVLIVILGLQLVACGKTNANATADIESANKSSEEKTSETVTEEATDETLPDVINIGALNGSVGTAIAIEEKLYENELGVKANILYFESGRDINTAFASGSIDVATFGSSPISLGISTDLGYEVIYINDILAECEALVAKNGSNIKEMKDLVGKTVATPFASTSHFSLLKALELEGISTDDVELVDLQPQDIYAAWERGDIDAAYVWTPVLADLKKDGVVITDSRQLAAKGAVTADITVANKEFASKYPVLTAKFVKTIIETYDLIKNNPSKAYEETAAGLDISKEEAKQMISEFGWLSVDENLGETYLGTSDSIGNIADVLKSTADFHVTQNNLDSAPDLTVFQKAVNPSYLEKAKDLK